MVGRADSSPRSSRCRGDDRRRGLRRVLRLAELFPGGRGGSRVGPARHLTFAGTFEGSDTLRFALVEGEGGTHNDLFSIVGDRLVTAGALDHESAAELQIRVEGADEEGARVETFAIAVADVNEPPSIVPSQGLDLRQNTIITSGATLALAVSDPDSGDTFTVSADSPATPGGPHAGTCAGLDCTIDFPAIARSTAGQFTIVVEVEDAAGLSSTADIPLTVAPALVTNHFDDGGEGTLRALVTAAAPGDVIAFDPAYFSEQTPRTIEVTSTLGIGTDLTLQGPGREALTLSAVGVDYVFNMEGTQRVSLSGFSFVGGGVRVYWPFVGAGPAVALRDARFSSATTAAFLCVGADVQMEHVVFEDNTCFGDPDLETTFDGAAIRGLLCDLTMNDARFVENRSTDSGGAIRMDAMSTLSLSRGYFFGNESASSGGAMRLSAMGASVRDTIFLANRAEAAGAIVASDGGPGNALELVNTTFFANEATVSADSAAIYKEGEISIVNSIFWGNEASAGGTLEFLHPAAASIAYSIVEGSGGSGAGWDPALAIDGGGNLDVDPLFLDVLAGDLRLHETSPAIDRGRNADAEASPTDLDGLPRIVDGNASGIATVDLGAFELQ